MLYCRECIQDLETNIRNTVSQDLTPQAIEGIIKSQYSAFLAVASKVAVVHDKVQHQKERFMDSRSKRGIIDNNIPGLSNPSQKVQLSDIASSLIQTQQVRGFGIK
jgi:hypothetical protein